MTISHFVTTLGDTSMHGLLGKDSEPIRDRVYEAAPEGDTFADNNSFKNEFLRASNFARKSTI